MLENAQEIRCYCRQHTLLGKFTMEDDTGEPVIHIKSWKGGTLYTEVVIVSGVVSIRCRNCYRWHRIRIKRGAPRLEDAQKNLPGKLATGCQDVVAS